MKKISVALTPDQLEAVLTLAENQLFRVKHIDPKIPGYIVPPEELEIANAAVQVLAEALKTVKQVKPRTVSAVHR